MLINMVLGEIIRMTKGRFVWVGGFLEVFFRSFRRGEIFSLIKRMNRMMENTRIVDVYRCFTLPDTVAGIVKLETRGHWSRLVPHRGENLIKEINGLKVEECSRLEPMPDGSLGGAVELKDIGWVLVKADRVIKEIEGMKIREVSSFIILPPGLIAGNMEAVSPPGESRKEVWCAFKEESFIRRIGEEEAVSTWIHGVWSDGTLVGTARLKDKRRVPFRGDKLLGEACGRKIFNVLSSSLDFPQPDGHLVMRVELEDGKQAILNDDTLIETIQGKRLLSVAPELHILSDGTLAGTVELEDYNLYLFKGDTLVNKIGRGRVLGLNLRVILPGDVLAGDIALENGRRLPFVGDALIEEAGGRRILEGRMLFALPNGNPVSLVKLEDGRELLLNGNELVESIGNRRIVGVGRVARLPDERLVGAAKLEDGREVPFRGDDLLERARGENVVDGSVDTPLPDGTVKGRITLEDGRRLSFFWFEDEVYLPFP
jgi:hypothetical protein